jgi:hypothetical protein
MVSQEQHMLPFPTDTAIPITPVPIFYLHEGEHPFCLLPDCICHAYEAQLRELLQGVLDGDLKLRKVYNGVLVGKGIR